MTLGFLDIFSGGEMSLILIAVLLLFGGDKMPEFARTLGKVLREFRKAASDVEHEIKRAMEEAEPAPPGPTIRPPQATLPQAPPLEAPADREPPPAEPPPGHFHEDHDDPAHGLD